ncbi:hypothetical protein HU200_021467 [Digitaria exilis]|uniref:KIB1-4 beta-propeller domain-containing protein n=1 Tax=Digitaria exilis TaxID=1010633 RepID=A0A835EZ43_9POAL|nr:hypothetical protein HU200_021467 [Digitaria exilis]
MIMIVIHITMEECLLVDVYSGAIVKPPKLKSTGNDDIYCGILAAPFNSSNSHLLFCSKSSMFLWQVGSNSWSEHPLDVQDILQIVLFKGEMIAMDLLGRFHRMRLVPQLSVQQVAVMWEDMVLGQSYKQWLVVCGDMLLLVDLPISIDPISGFCVTFKVLSLDFSVEPAKWVKVDDSYNNALFVSNDTRTPTFSCTNPVRWGGKSNSIYFANSSTDPSDRNEPWIVTKLGEVVPFTDLCATYSSELIQVPRPGGRIHQQQSLWVVPSFVYGIGS